MSSGPFMSLVYRFLKFLVQVVLRIFYPKTTVIGKEHLRFKEAAIAISNHPNTLIDPLQVASRVHKQVFFLANAGLFSTPFTNWLFNTLYCIPIKRKQDRGAPGVSNEDSFAKCDAFLGKGGVLFIAPEGGSVMERRLRPFKTGTVRIALSAAEKKNFDLDISILPIGVHYDRPTDFGSSCVINVGEAIKVKDWQVQYTSDPQTAVRTFTDEVRDKVQALVIDVAEGEQQQIHPLVESICRNDDPLDSEADFRRGQSLAKQLKQREALGGGSYQKFAETTLQYGAKLGTQAVDDKAVAMHGENLITQGILLVIGFPFFAYGAVNHLLAAGIPALLARTLKVYIGYQATVKATVGLFTVPLFYYLQSELVSRYFGNTVSWVYLLTLPMMAWLAWAYWKGWGRFRKDWAYTRLNSADKEALQSSRSDIVKYIQTHLLTS
ncbi:MAG: 1-acyl-sn-glycerol-3-phosphate acyltransferase [Saprospiraceae bacterium]|nr:1-acyl-sn-glycerol-3-phosphate acyltransferase [Saprospiraceae bacterium]